MIVAKRIETNLSSGRKIFRLFKYFDELAEIIKHARTSKADNLSLEIIFYCSKICAFFYFLLDNIVWFSSIKVISKYIAYNIKWKKTKDIFSFARCIFEIWRCGLLITQEIM